MIFCSSQNLSFEEKASSFQHLWEMLTSSPEKKDRPPKILTAYSLRDMAVPLALPTFKINTNNLLATHHMFFRVCVCRFHIRLYCNGKPVILWYDACRTIIYTREYIRLNLQENVSCIPLYL